MNDRAVVSMTRYIKWGHVFHVYRREVPLLATLTDDRNFPHIESFKRGIKSLSDDSEINQKIHGIKHSFLESS